MASPILPDNVDSSAPSSQTNSPNADEDSQVQQHLNSDSNPNHDSDPDLETNLEHSLTLDSGSKQRLIQGPKPNYGLNLGLNPNPNHDSNLDLETNLEHSLTLDSGSKQRLIQGSKPNYGLNLGLNPNPNFQVSVPKSKPSTHLDTSAKTQLKQASMLKDQAILSAHNALSLKLRVIKLERKLKKCLKELEASVNSDTSADNESKQDTQTKERDAARCDKIKEKIARLSAKIRSKTKKASDYMDESNDAHSKFVEHWFNK
ncbi:hypothetical protein BATDEDRAFT_87633 [Batrachochytrium dendrobatidis JAM81]|uniref:Uncharacterized protein n=1 Tax=Batrachochytrium dendrobatidis (strain JAM81 / FGSC 10211) TaxID=684364 RepID=F4P0Y3_BATDJ|nr:uncharacterized protein BATDEDRAFT_87633 [Batrachochytrium dendrobatidis JAM81]EGF81672.1 hypothetical protein BATDEDRAFT_87633 [Batrachochytrium dendrobatidis JAM81]|eukprot:XP_006678286.1 hypothetical protein BATDEDRAFT_87633 [Batrachochytrium dendrobatidis JAM81]